jgi:hypothetical protein
MEKLSASSKAAKYLFVPKQQKISETQPTLTLHINQDFQTMCTFDIFDLMRA